MKILITGIGGFLGSNLVDRLKDYELYGLARKADVVKGVRTFSSDQLSEIEFQPDVIIMCHAAVSSGAISVTTDSLYEVNVSLTERIIRKFPHSFIIYISTCSVYERTQVAISEQSAVEAQSDYAFSKLWAERIVLQSNQSTILRISSLYGTGMKENTLIPNYINSALNTNAIEVWGKGTRKQNYVHVEDVVNCVLHIISNRESVIHRVLLGVAERQYSNIEVAEAIAALTGAEIRFVKEDSSPSSVYDNTDTRKLISWQPKMNLKVELEKYIEWKKLK